MRAPPLFCLALLTALAIASGHAAKSPPAAPAAETAWNYEKFAAAAKASGRNPTLTEKQFLEIQAKKPKALALIEAYLKKWFGRADGQRHTPRALSALLRGAAPGLPGLAPRAPDPGHHLFLLGDLHYALQPVRTAERDPLARADARHRPVLSLGFTPVLPGRPVCGPELPGTAGADRAGLRVRPVGGGSGGNSSDDGRDYLARHFFDLRASTADRPGFFTLLRLNRLGLILPKISLVPQEEVGTLVSLAVLIQAFLFAILTMLLPLARLRRGNATSGELLRTIVYFAGLGLAFLFVEIALIERFTLFLGDGTTAFALVLAGMLAFSGLGSVLAQRFQARRGVVLAVAIIAAALVFHALFLFDLMRQGMNAPFTLKILFVLAAIAPAALAMGMPFPLGLASLRKEANDSLLPWAWAINGAFSVIATPLASLIATSVGYTAILAAAATLYALALAAFPGARNSATGA